MNVGLCVELGVRSAAQRRVGVLTLDAATVGTTSQWAGSYHVLSMDRHYDDYVLTNRVLSLPTIPGFPVAHPYERLTGKIRATGVTGNIGEAVAAVFARRAMQAQIQDIAHVKPRQPFKRRKAPDYMMRLGPLMPNVFGSVLPQSTPSTSFTWPEWWPVESKARTTQGGALAARRDALRQLVEYWSLLVHTQPSVVGYGLIVTFSYQVPREVRATLIIPKCGAKLVEAIQERNEEDDAAVRKNLYGC